MPFGDALSTRSFFALAMSQHGATFQYAKSTRGAKTPGFLVTVGGHPVVIEVGGRTKGRSQFKGVDYERKVVLYHDETAGRHEPGRRVPLPCLDRIPGWVVAHKEGRSGSEQ